MKVIGISGLARSGKDLFAKVAKTILESKNLVVEKHALAYELKNDLRSLLQEKLGVDSFTEITEEKNLIRPILVAYADALRKKTEGKYFTTKLQSKIAQSNADVVLVTDIRYDKYTEDECYWVQKVMNGKIVHITKYKMSPAPSTRRISTSKPVKIYNQPPNDHEMLNDPWVKKKSDYAFEWEDRISITTKLEDDVYIIDKVSEALKNINVI